MSHLIDKSALVAEIKTLLAFYLKEIEDNKEEPWTMDIAVRDILQEILSFIDTLEVKEVDLDDYYHKFLEKEWFGNNHVRTMSEMMAFTAKHFFKLGLNASNPLTWEDMMIIHKCIKDAMNYHISAFGSYEGQQKIYEDVLKRFKAQKGE